MGDLAGNVQRSEVSSGAALSSTSTREGRSFVRWMSDASIDLAGRAFIIAAERRSLLGRLLPGLARLPAAAARRLTPA